MKNAKCKLQIAGKPTTRQVLAAVVHDTREELRLNNPDYRAIGRMLADALEAIDGALSAATSVLGTDYTPEKPVGSPPLDMSATAEIQPDVGRFPAPPELRAAEIHQLRTRGKKEKTGR
jgi:hypothetical protein